MKLRAFFLGILALLLWLMPFQREMRVNSLWLLCLFVVLFSMRDKWLQAFGMGLMLSFYFAGGVFTYLTLSVVTLAAMDRLGDVVSHHAVAKVYVAAAVGAALLSAYTWWRFGYFVGPWGNTVFAGPLLALGALFALRVHWVVSVLLALAALCTQSTTAALCLIVGYAPVKTYRGKWTRGVIIAMQAGAAILYVTMVDTAHQFRDRIDMTLYTLEKGREKLFGWGIGGFQEYVSSAPGIDLQGQRWAQAHSDLVQMFFELGWVPLLLVLAFIGVHMARLWGARNKVLTMDKKIALGAMSMFIVFSMVGFPFHYAPAVAAFAVVWLFYRRAFPVAAI